MRRALGLAIVVATISPALAPDPGSGAGPGEQRHPPVAIGELSSPTPRALAFAQRWTDAIARIRAVLKQIESAAEPDTVAGVLEPLNDNVLTPVDNLLNEARLLARVHPDPRMRAAGRRAVAEIEAAAAEVRASPGLSARVRAIDAARESPGTRHYLKRLRLSMHKAGAGLSASDRIRAPALHKQIAFLGETFLDNLARDTRSLEIDVATFATLGLPADFLRTHQSGPDGKVRVAAPADTFAFLTYANSDTLRRALYHKHHQRGYPQNRDVLLDLLAKRHEAAKLLGYPTWAELAVEEMLLVTPRAVQEFIDRIGSIAEGRLRADIAKLTDRLRRDDPLAGALHDWQRSYYLAKLAAQDGVEAASVRQYFTYDTTQRGLLALSFDLFGIRFRKVDVPVWHDSVEAYDVEDAGVHIGRVYFDTQPREGKAATAETLARRNGVAGLQTPEVVLIGAFPRHGPIDHRDVVSLFHEFGHVLHVIFGGNQRWVDMSGYNTEWDVTEVPASVFEELARHPAVLRRFATNARGEPIPHQLIPRTSPAPLGEGLTIRRQLAYAELALRLHGGDPRSLDIPALTRDAFAKHLPVPGLEGTYPELGFHHLYEYGPRYYGYVSAVVFAKDIFATLFETRGVVSREAGARFRTEFLERGGSLPGRALLARTLGRPASVEAFQRWLEIEPAR